MSKESLIIIIIIVYVLISYIISTFGERKEIGKRRLFIACLLFTPVIGLAFYFSSSHRKINTYIERNYKCERCGYVFSDNHDHCPFCEKEGYIEALSPVKKFMT